jgi:hypothetical protein
VHYIERPATVRVQYLDRKGNRVDKVFSGMKARFILHEMDHMDGVLFTRRIPDTNHVVLADGFSTMSDWSDDYPSLEARSTFLYTTFTPPYTFQTDSVTDANLLDRKFEDGIYPGHEADAQMRVENAAYDELQRLRWREVKTKFEGDETHAGEEDEPSQAEGEEEDAASP